GAPALASDDPLGDLAGDAPPPATASAAADDPFGEGAGFEVPAYDETPAGEPLLSMGADTGPGEGIDLGSELGELFGAQSAVEEPAPAEASTELGDAGLADIFKEFKKGVDKQLGKEDYDTRYNLGI